VPADNSRAWRRLSAIGVTFMEEEESCTTADCRRPG
jgi:hypothetical protein